MLEFSEIEKSQNSQNKKDMVSLRNKLNDLTAREWIPETISVWTQRGLGKNHPAAQIEKEHPAPFSFTDVGRLIRFFTKKGNTVLDPFVGIGSTLKACAIEGRKGIGIELNERFVDLTKERLQKEVPEDCPAINEQTVLLGDCRDLLNDFEESSVDFIVTSPPYWCILHKEDHKVNQERKANGLDSRYSDDEADLGNIKEYDCFLDELVSVFRQCTHVLKPEKHMAIIVGDFREKSQYHIFHADLANELEKYGLTLKGITILYQRHKRVFPYGYPASFVPNLHHQYILIFQKEKKAKGKKVSKISQNKWIKDINKIHEGDCVKMLRKLPDGCCQLIIADPPYNIGPKFGIEKEWDNSLEWLPWCREWLAECKRILSDGGNLFLYGIHHYLCYLQCALYDLGMTYRRQIIWNYENGFAGYTKTLSAHYEPILWFSKGDGYTYHPIREPYKSTERLKHKITKNGKTWTPHPDGRLAGDIWSFPTLAGRRFREEKVDHPTQKPLALTHRIIQHFSNEDDVVVVPFAGSGTECVSAIMNGRKVWGCEINPDYIMIAEKRIADIGILKTKVSN